MKLFFLFLILHCCTISAIAHQTTDDYKPKNTHITFPNKKPLVLIDEAHNNFHTMNGGYKPFAEVLKSDGYNVKRNTEKISEKSLSSASVLVIANALSDKNEDSWDLPIYSAFSRKEVEVLYKWVSQGGSLFLIADHMPFPKAADSLAAIFGFQFNNGYAKNIEDNNSKFVYTFTKKEMASHPALIGIRKIESISSIKTFTGQAFLPPKNAKSILILPPKVMTLMPSKSWELNDDTPKFSVSGWSQGATLDFQKGRIAVFGEAAMFTSQYVERENKTIDPWVGLKAKEAKYNEQFLLNIMHWLSFKI
jgi:hypothetical protein